MKKALVVATVYKFLSFEISDMNILKKMGYEIHTATNMSETDWLKDDGSLDFLEVKKHQIDFGRLPFSKQSIIAYRQLKKLLNEEHFDVIHCHTPVAATITRMVAKPFRKQGVKIIYTSHGFHFHKLSSKLSWLIYYPIEYVMAFFTDMIITINKEDFDVIKKFHVKEKRYIPGVGVDIQYISSFSSDKEVLFTQYGIPRDAFVLMSVGELSDRKNHEIVIKAMSKLNDTSIYYIICGTGKKEKNLKNMAMQLGLDKRVIFLGYQPHDQVIKLLHAIDVGVLPSKIEGLGLAGIETLASGKPLIASGVHGIKDYVIENETGIRCNPLNASDFSAAIIKLKDDKNLYKKCCENAIQMSWKFDIRNVQQLMLKNYKRLGL